MIDRVKFDIMGDPVGKGRPKFSHHQRKDGSAYTVSRTPDKTACYENLVRLEYQKQYGQVRFRGEVAATIVSYFAVPKSATVSKHKQMILGILNPTKKPDLDNIAKIILDSLNGIAYNDDAQVTQLNISKRYATWPSVSVTLEGEVECSTTKD